MRNKLTKLVVPVLTTLALVAPFFVGAQAVDVGTPVTPPTGGGAPVTSVTQLFNLLRRILNWVATLFWIVAVIFIFWAAFLYLTAGGDQEKVKKANHQFLYAIIAMIVGVIAFGVPRLVETIIRAQQ